MNTEGAKSSATVDGEEETSVPLKDPISGQVAAEGPDFTLNRAVTSFSLYPCDLNDESQGEKEGNSIKELEESEEEVVEPLGLDLAQESGDKGLDVSQGGIISTNPGTTLSESGRISLV